MPEHCEVIEMRNSADAVSYACSRAASTQCFDCGADLCESHGNVWQMPCDFLAVLFVLPPNGTLEARLSGPRSSGAKNCLNLFLVKIVGLPGRQKDTQTMPNAEL
jgi:hypothetical protein